MPAMPRAWDAKAAPGICRWCGEGGLPKRKNGKPNLRVHYHPDCAELKDEVFAGSSWALWCLIRRDGRKCAGCGLTGKGLVGKGLEVDHVTPLHRVDRTAPEAWKHWSFANLQLLCHDCHQAKSTGEARARAASARAEKRAADPQRELGLRGA